MRITRTAIAVMSMAAVLLPVSAVAIPGVVNSPVARAECTRVSPWPSFTKYAPSAKDVILGTVTWSALPGGWASQFTLTVDEVLRGTADPTIEFDRFRSGAPQPICPGDSKLMVRPCDRLAIAYGARYPGQKQRVDVVAFVKPSTPDPQILPKMQRLSEAPIRKVLGLPAVTPAPTAEASPSVLPVPSGAPASDTPVASGSPMPSVPTIVPSEVPASGIPAASASPVPSTSPVPTPAITVTSPALDCSGGPWPGP